MNARWWSCVLGLLCMPAEVLLITWTVSQNPSSISRMSVNSSVEILCSTSLSDPLGLYLRRQFHPSKDILYLNLKGGQVSKGTTAEDFNGRIEVEGQPSAEGFSFVLRLSLLRLHDTNLYFCRWNYFSQQLMKPAFLSSNGTVVIVGEQKPCQDQALGRTLISLSVVAFIVVVLLLIGALALRCRTFKKIFRTAAGVKPPRTVRPQHVCPQHHDQHRPYWVTSDSFIVSS